MLPVLTTHDRLANPAFGRRPGGHPPVIILASREHIVMDGFIAVVEPLGKLIVLQVEE